jgi:hypothetical protein
MKRYAFLKLLTLVRHNDKGSSDDSNESIISYLQKQSKEENAEIAQLKLDKEQLLQELEIKQQEASQEALQECRNLQQVTKSGLIQE